MAAPSASPPTRARSRRRKGTAASPAAVPCLCGSARWRRGRIATSKQAALVTGSISVKLGFITVGRDGRRKAMHRAALLVTSGLAAAATLLMAAGPASASAQYHRPIIAIGANQSNNWSGYNQGMLEKGIQFHQISGSWVVPTATPHKSGEAEYCASWVGIGGGCVNA